jgi:hypothetical protein
MIIDLFHNKIIKDTATDAFIDSFNTVLVPMLQYKYGDAIEAITMYEDYIADGFLSEGFWHYPLSVKLSGEDAIICWVKWPVTKKTFRNNVPYTYIGSETVAFSFAEDVPEEFRDKLTGRAIDYDRSALKLSVEAVTDDPLLLVGKYSQTFIDELARQITLNIAKTVGVEGLEKSTMELQLVFAPGTYLEHTSENVTYRRLLLVDTGCQARDFWVKWTRIDGVGGVRVSDHAAAHSVKFEIGEDAPHKIREKEYRFLATANPNKYQSAMGKKTVTEWRDIIKRAIKHGILVKVATEKDLAKHADDLFAAFSAVSAAAEKKESVEAHMPVVESKPVSTDPFDVVAALSKQMSAPIPETEPVKTAEDDSLAALVRATLGRTGEAEAEPVTVAEESDEIPVFEEIPDEAEEEELDDTALEAEEELVFEPVFAPITESVEEPEASVFDFAVLDEESEETFTMGEVTLEEYERTVDKAKEIAPAPSVDTEAIRREIEAQVRLELEAKARQQAEEEAQKLRQERERLREENERLMKIAREAEERRLAEEAARKKEEEARRLAEEERQRALAAERAEAERQRLEQENRRRLEEQERARIAETARLAVEEQKRIEAERQARAEREHRAAMEKEAERLRQEEEARRADEKRRIAEQQRREEEERRQRAAAVAQVIPTIVTKKANLIFRHTVDVNIAKRIKELIEETLRREEKTDVNIRIKAYPGDSSNVFVLEIKLPDSENNLLVSMMQTIGRSGIGVTKIVID